MVSDPRDETLHEAVARHARRSPDLPAAIFPGRGSADSDVVLTFGDLDTRARALAAGLREVYAPGERVLLLHTTGPDFFVDFLGCLHAQLIAVPAPTPSPQAHAVARTAGIVGDCRPCLALTDATSHEIAADQLRQAGWTGRLAVSGEIGTTPSETGPPEAARISDIAFLQYTSGSTTAPKGVMVSHANLRHNVTVIRDRLGTAAGRRFGGWLPLSHDMGLIGLGLTPLMLGLTTVLMPPHEFLRRPLRWLELIDRYEVNHTAAPNFAYDFCVRRIKAEQARTVDLSSLKWAVSGAEPVDARTLESFSALFEPAGLRPDVLLPCYGMAEATLLISGAGNGVAAAVQKVDPGRLERNTFELKADGHPVVSSGVPGDFDVRIVDPDIRATLPDGRVGEIWIRGASVARGYWRNPEATAETFGATTTDDGETGWLRTGDLGVRHDGHLYVTGRIKDVIIIRGRNLHAHDLERTVAGFHPAFRGLSGSAFALGTPAEEVVVIHEARWARDDADGLAELGRLVKLELGRQIGVVPSLVFVTPGKIRRTTSGKVRRSEMRSLLVDGGLATLYADLNPAVRRRLESRLAGRA